MAKVFVVVEHRQGLIRDATFELVSLARELQSASGLEPTAVVIGHGVRGFAGTLSKYLPRTFAVENEALADFRYETYAAVLKDILERETPLVTLCPQSAFGMELFPRLSVESQRPCATDCIKVEMDGAGLSVVRSIYNGKILSRSTFAPSGGYLVTVRSGSYAPATEAGSAGAVEEFPCPPFKTPFRTEFLGYREAAAGAVDISQSPFLVSIGRGIKDVENIPKAQELADRLGAVLSCSRPVVDKKWLGKERQVGTSGRTVKPKVYLALGISGAFQHLAGIKGSGVFIAVNRDAKAPIFRAADYGVVEDMFKIIDALKEQSGS
ncbi:MAG: electron transfer flavoprotein subunit alpha/FixB family protein [Candidatus Krumholzibacteria bacterium]|nr:electron transfer flavoprotein subunit alpha/FixB family protein [Candidatus Krumholzibacteria bacterium]